jgi:chemotaxis response regulator CheB
MSASAKQDLDSERSADGGEATAPVRVVVAEDSYVIREFLTMALGTAPEVELVAVCSNGNELQTAIENWNPDVVLTDIRMPPSGPGEGVRVVEGV